MKCPQLAGHREWGLGEGGLGSEMRLTHQGCGPVGPAGGAHPQDLGAVRPELPAATCPLLGRDHLEAQRKRAFEPLP